MSKTISFSEMDRINRHHVVAFGEWRQSSTLPGFDWPLATKRPTDYSHQNPGTVNKQFIWYVPYAQGFEGDLYAYLRSRNLLADYFYSRDSIPVTYKFYPHIPSVSKDANCLLLMNEIAKEGGVFKDENYLTRFVNNHPMSSIAMYLEYSKVSGGYKYRWVVVFIDFEYYSSNRFFTTIGTESDFKDMIRYVRYAKFCGKNLKYLPDVLPMVLNPKVINNIKYVAQTIRRSAVSYFVDQIETMLNLTKYGDTPTLEDDIDDLLNNKLRDFGLELQESDFGTVVDQTYITGKGYLLLPSQHENFLKPDKDFSLLSPVNFKDIWRDAKDAVVATYDAKIAGIPEAYKRFRVPLTISEPMRNAIEEETERIRNIVLANVEKATAALIAYEDETALEHVDALDPSKNPFLIYSREDSDQVSAPMFKDISIRPGKPAGGLIKNTRIPYSAFKKVPSRLSELIRTPDAEGRYTRGGGDKEKSGNLLFQLAALGVGGYFLYKQAGG